ncbi:hypothetical protein ACIHAX_13765 [Nocardia sp. NPDC051929]|uniref:hypothetical protein n=1 Tax=Nocardia sp. NPDC051929 TaxID=3364327 RepID=UPI0037CA4781
MIVHTPGPGVRQATPRQFAELSYQEFLRPYPVDQHTAAAPPRFPCGQNVFSVVPVCVRRGGRADCTGMVADRRCLPGLPSAVRIRGLTGTMSPWALIDRRPAVRESVVDAELLGGTASVRQRSSAHPEAWKQFIARYERAAERKYVLRDGTRDRLFGCSGMGTHMELSARRVD